MVVVKGARSHALAILLAVVGWVVVSCGAPDHDPAETVRRYLDAVANDPIRTLSLVSDRFHRTHGLRFEEVGDQRFLSVDDEGFPWDFEEKQAADVKAGVEAALEAAREQERANA